MFVSLLVSTLISGAAPHCRSTSPAIASSARPMTHKILALNLPSWRYRVNKRNAENDRRVCDNWLIGHILYFKGASFVGLSIVGDAMDVAFHRLCKLL